MISFYRPIAFPLKLLNLVLDTSFYARLSVRSYKILEYNELLWILILLHVVVLAVMKGAWSPHIVQQGNRLLTIGLLLLTESLYVHIIFLHKCICSDICWLTSEWQKVILKICFRYMGNILLLTDLSEKIVQFWGWQPIRVFIVVNIFL